jgi:hypothetical protein
LIDLRDALSNLPAQASAEEIQDVVYEVGRREPFLDQKKKAKDGKPGVSLDWFNMLYQVLLGQERGPRFGSFVAVYGVQNTVDMIDGRLAPASSVKKLERQKFSKVTRVTGKLLNEKWGVGALHALYRSDGKSYHWLTHFPGALFDPNGYILFETRESYEKCSELLIGPKNTVHVRRGISSLSGYVRCSE